MDNKLEGIEPARVMKYFGKICSIPHGSYHTDEISDYIVNFAKEHDLDYTQDASGNVIVFKKGSEGCEDAAPLMLQGHMDMVLEKNDGVDKDLEKEPIDVKTDGTYLFADGTTLGGDDGIAVAMMLAVLDDDSLVHPPLECVFTVNEEVGLLGMNTLDVSNLKAKRMLNLDSESEGVLTVGCAGGTEVHIHLPIEKKKNYGNLLTIMIGSLKGGHSGEDINKGRANANVLMARLLDRISRKVDVCLADIGGGTKDNAIARSATAKLLVDDGIKKSALEEQVEKFRQLAKNEYQETDPDITIEFAWESRNKKGVDTLSRKDTRKVIHFLFVLPDGMLKMDPTRSGFPRTSENLGIIAMAKDDLAVTYLCRSNVNSERKYIVNQLKCLSAMVGAGVSTRGSYPAWEYHGETAFQKLAERVYKESTGLTPRIEVTHGGLECGIMAGKIEGLECISAGPDMSGIHTPDEKLSIPSTQKLWKFVTALFEACAKE